MAENAEQKRLFTEALQKQCGDEDKERTQFLTERKYEQVCTGLEEFYEAEDASAKKAVQKVHSQVYAWAKKYELVSFKDSKVLIFKNGADGDGDTLALDQAQVVSHHGRVFADLLKIHVDGGHCKAKTFLQRIVIAHGKSIPRWAAEAFVNCCPACVRRLPRKPSSKLTLLFTTLRGQLAPAVFAQVEKLVADMQSQKVQLNREQFVQRIEAMQHQAVCVHHGEAQVQLTRATRSAATTTESPRAESSGPRSGKQQNRARYPT
jgi:hypothetical protein